VTTSNGQSGYGSVFELRPPAAPGGNWRYATLYSFGEISSDGQYPQGQLLFGPDHALYGTTYEGGVNNDGTVFRLDPPKSNDGDWTEEILWNFSGSPSDGYGPVGPLVIGNDGAIYGVTKYGGSGEYGTVFELTPSAAGGNWKENILYNFGTAFGDSYPTGVILGPNHVLYGTTLQPDGKACDDVGTFPCGILFELRRPDAPGGAWTEATLITFTVDSSIDGVQPYAPPILGPDGVLYGTTGSGGADGYGTIFKLLPPSSPGGEWTEVVLYSFTDAVDGWLPTGIAFGPDGNIYGTTTLILEKGGVGNYGTVFQFMLQ